MTEPLKVTDHIVGKVHHDDIAGGFIWDEAGHIVAEIKGWGRIKHNKRIPDAEIFQDRLGQFIADAINEKLTKERSK